jgi:RNA polymerase sigma factor (sigma-70 family)
MVETVNDIDQIVQGCLANDRKAQKMLYQHFYSFTMTIALRYSRDEMDAADILSHAFVKIFKSIGTYNQTKGSLHAWIKRIVINEGLNHIKSRERFSDNVELETVPEPAINNSVLEQMGADEILDLIQKLPPATHAVFVLYAIEGYSHKEIAAQLNISEGTSRWHLSEARKTLQDQLSHIKL